jgi:predicted nucleic acid-binding protein
MRFWDSSAIVPLLVAEAGRDRVIDALERDPIMLVWWGSQLECTSAIARREREEHLDSYGATDALERMRALAASWHEVQPVNLVRTVAMRLLRTHPLRAADALQLAAAIVASERESSTLEFVSLDRQLVSAAQREGFQIANI